ncbi:hypothetical protein [Leisingera sp. M523]|uniref:hypothetical protein n=1 Tax=Leisingera sp. M523 TaxID=2867013 RepID=UPI0021A643B8|nr:hypothetical protein [Leisingera sp. M523]UWQ30268.1 hypothetical protein K3557_06945 [Leisingera sp. M523]
MGAVIPALATLFAPAAATTAAVGTGAVAAGAAAGVGAGASTIGAIAAGASTGAMGTAAAGGLLGSGWLGTIGGGLVAGLGQGMMAKQEAKDEERRELESEQRREDSYKGVGQSMRFWEQDSLGDDENPNAVDPGFQRADANSNENLRVGQRENPARMGEKFRNRKASRPERFRYDRAAGQIVPA